jgi:hypothetical protein
MYTTLLVTVFAKPHCHEIEKLSIHLDYPNQPVGRVRVGVVVNVRVKVS